ncbi:MAG: curved DNA-binding protein [Myxococcota bacterium]|jgi:curved DNA-binding protein
MAKDYYDLLEVARTADQGEIKKAFRRKAVELHPDKNPDNPEAEEQFKDLNEAYAVLSDTEKRTHYDRFGHQQFHQRFSADDIFRGADFSGFEGAGMGADFFANMFGGGRGGGRRMRGADIATDVEVGFTEACLGGQRQVRFERADGPQTLTIRIPAGVEPGSKIRARGSGQPAPMEGSRPGDLIIRILVSPHPELKRDGADLSCTVMAPLSTFALGGKVEIPSLEGTKKIRVKEGTAAGSRQRLRGLGAAGAATGRGDLYVTLEPEIPTELDEETTAIFEQLRELGH